jgi:hypothetical protein
MRTGIPRFRKAVSPHADKASVHTAELMHAQETLAHQSASTSQSISINVSENS